MKLPEDIINLDNLEDFKRTMWGQLELHKEEKTGLDDVELAKVWELVMDNIESRLELLKTTGPDDIKKQCIHMANYLFFLWCKT